MDTVGDWPASRNSGFAGTTLKPATERTIGANGEEMRRGAGKDAGATIKGVTWRKPAPLKKYGTRPTKDRHFEPVEIRRRLQASQTVCRQES